MPLHKNSSWTSPPKLSCYVDSVLAYFPISTNTLQALVPRPRLNASGNPSLSCPLYQNCHQPPPLVPQSALALRCRSRKIHNNAIGLLLHDGFHVRTTRHLDFLNPHSDEQTEMLYHSQLCSYGVDSKLEIQYRFVSTQRLFWNRN